MERINGGIKGDFIFGVGLVLLGLYAFGDIYLGYMWFGFGVALLIWVIIKLAFNMGMKSSLCPKCGHKFAREEHWAFTHGLSSRYASPCPGCQTVLIKSKWPWRIINASPVIIAACVCVSFTESGTPLFYYLAFALLIVSFVSFDIGMATLRYEIVGEPKESS